MKTTIGKGVSHLFVTDSIFTHPRSNEWPVWSQRGVTEVVGGITGVKAVRQPSVTIPANKRLPAPDG